jgi:hypothetical protein
MPPLIGFRFDACCGKLGAMRRYGTGLARGCATGALALAGDRQAGAA